MKKVQYIISYLLIPLILLTGCGQVQESKAAMGRYVEKNIELPEKALQMMQDKEGVIHLLCKSKDEKEIIRYTLQEDYTWSKEEQISINSLAYEGIFDYREDEKGLLCSYATSNQEIGIARQAQDGTWREVLLSDEHGVLRQGYDEIYTVVQLVNGDFLVQDSWGGAVKSYDSQTGKLKKTYDEACYSFQVLGQKLYIANMSGIIKVYDTITAKELEQIIYPVTDHANVIHVTNEGIYVFNGGGIQYKSNAGDIWETVVEPTRTSLTRADYALATAYAWRTHEYILSFYSEGNIKIKTCYYDESIATETTEEIIVYISEKTPIINQILGIYQEKHPEIDLVIQTINSDMPLHTWEMNLKTELLAGSGPDLIMLDSLPTKQYIEEGLLADISDMITPYLEDETSYKNVLETFKEGNGIYAIPVRWTMPMLWGDANILSQAKDIHELAAYKRKHPDEVLFNKNMLQLYRQIYRTSTPCWVDEAGNYSREKVKTFLEDLKTVTEDKVYETSEEEIIFEEYKFPELLDVAEGTSKVFILEPRSPIDIVGAQTVLEARKNGKVVPYKMDGKALYNVSGIFGINANSQHIETAQEIVDAILSEEVQGVANAMGMPLSEKAVTCQEEKLIGFTDAIVDDKGRRLELKDEKTAYYEASKANLKAPSIYIQRDYYLEQAIGEAVEMYHKNQLPLDEILDRLDDKMALRSKKNSLS